MQIGPDEGSGGVSDYDSNYYDEEGSGDEAADVFVTSNKEDDEDQITYGRANEVS